MIYKDAVTLKHVFYGKEDNPILKFYIILSTFKKITINTNLVNLVIMYNIHFHIYNEPCF